MAALRSGDPASVGPFRLVSRLGAGGMGRVYLGVDEDGREAAVKVVHPAFAEDTGFRKRFAREVRTAERVTSPWTAAVIMSDPDADPPWLATEYVPGPSLEQRVSESGPIPEDEVIVLAYQLARALDHLHSMGVVHRDIKPSNVLLAPDGPRLIDFGIARAADATKITHTGSLVGTPAFMSPEQAAADEDTGTASDVFSLASVLTYAAKAVGPFGSTTNPMAILLKIADGASDTERVPAPLRPHIDRCLTKDPASRPTATQLALALEPLARRSAEAAGLPSPGSAAGPGKPRTLRRIAWPVVVVCGVGLVAAVAGLLALRPADTGATGAAAQAGPIVSNAVIATVPVGELPDDVVVSNEGRRAYVHDWDDTIVEFNPENPEAKGSVRLIDAADVVVSPDGRRAYVPLRTGSLAVYDTSVGEQVAAVPIEAAAQSVTIAPDGRAVSVVHSPLDGGVDLTVVDTATNTVTATVPIVEPGQDRLSGQPMWVEAADAGSVWVGGGTSGVTVVDTARGEVSGGIPALAPAAVVFAGDKGYARGPAKAGVTVIDAGSRKPTGEITTPANVAGMAAAPNGRYLFLAVGGAQQPSSVQVIDTATGSLAAQIPLGSVPGGVALTPDGTRLLVTSPSAATVTIVDTTPYA